MEEGLVLCDTNVFINFFNGNEETINIFRKLGDKRILIPSVTVMELYQRMSNKTELNRMRKNIKNYYSTFQYRRVNANNRIHQ